MSGNKYDVVATQFVESGTLHPDAHMFFNNMSVKLPDVVAVIMTQLSLKMGLKQWKGKAYEAAYSEMKQLHMREGKNRCRRK